jgi:hypothetical protein
VGEGADLHVQGDKAARDTGSKAKRSPLSDRHRRVGDDAALSRPGRFFGITIAMFFDDHGFPHFQARHTEGEAKVRIDTLEVIDSNLGQRHLRFVLAWAELRQQELEENWRRA